MGKRLFLALSLSLVVLFVLLPAAGWTAFAILAVAETPEAATPIPADGAPPAEVAPSSEAPAPAPTSLLEEVAPTRTPQPTATPGALQQEVTRLVARAGLARTRFLGLTIPEWLSLVGSLLIVLVGYLIGTWVIRRLLPRAARRTATTFDDHFLQAIGSDVRWLVVLLSLQFATNRLTYFSAELKTILQDAYFIVGLVLGVRILFKLVDLADEWSRARMRDASREAEIEPLLVLLTRVSRVLVVLITGGILLSYFGVNITAFATALGIGGLALSLAAQDTIADAIAGFVILVDRPFRIGDRIEIQEAGTWGDVVDIGLRTTRIRTRDNRLVIVPNSVIGKNQVINYTYPDPQYRIETAVHVAYGTDIEAARRVLIDTVRQVEGVLPDKPVDALYIEMGDSAMVFRVRWWIESYVDTRRMLDRVHTALQHALDAAEIESPFPTQNLHLQVEPETAGRIAQTLQDQKGERTGS
jgi:MscS family membrane protein